VPGEPGVTTLTPGVGVAGTAAAPTGPTYLEQLEGQINSLAGALQSAGPAFEKKLRYQLDGLRKLHKEQMEFVTQANKDQGAAFDEAISLRNDFEAKRTSLADAQKDAAEGERQKLDNINNEILNYEIDPNRAYKSTWQVVGAAIAAAAGAYAQGLSGGRVPNTALSIINKAIDRDIQAQKMEIGKLQTAASIQNNIYGRMIQEHGNESRALAEARAAALGVAKLKLSKLKSTMASGLKLRAIQAMEQRLEIEYSKSVMDSTRMATTAALNGRLKEMDMVLRAGATGTSSKQTVADKIAKVVPQFNDLKKIWGDIDFKDALNYFTRYGSMWGYGGEEGAGKVKAYIQARNTTVKEIVQIFEGSKPSDLDWRVMVELLPEYYHKKAYGSDVIESFKGFLQAKGGTGLKKGDIARWALDSKRISYSDLQGVSNESIDKVKFDIGFEEAE
jgi:cytochrome c556